jgi:SAM-dependent methyltransferase
MTRLLVLGCGRKIKQNAVNIDCVPIDRMLSEAHKQGLNIRCVDPTTVAEDLLHGTWFWWYDLNNISSRPGSPFWLYLLLGRSFDRVEAEDVLEHVDDPIAVVQEIGRVLKVGGELWIRGPDYRHPEIVWADLTHKRAFADRTFDGFDPDTYDGQHYGHYHGEVKFRITERATQRNKGLEWTLVKR